MKFNWMKRKPRGKKQRKGGATTELAVCLPVIVLLVFASIEACSMIFLRQALCATTYEGVRVAVRDNATNTDVLARCQEVLDGRSIGGATVSLNPTNVSVVDPGDPITVSVTASCDANSIMPPWFFGGRSLTASSAMVKE